MRLTHKSIGNISKTGYWSQNKKQELINKLAAYEDICDDPEELAKKIRGEGNGR